MSGLDIYSIAVVAFCVVGIIWSYTRPVRREGFQPSDRIVTVETDTED